MDFRVLGPLEVHTAAGPLPLGGTKQRAVLAILLLHVNRVVATDRLIEGLWGEEPPETAGKALHNHISALRKLLEPERRRDGLDEALVTQPPGYMIRLDPDELDLTRFERLRAQAHRALEEGDAAAARGHLADALALWRGPPLADCGFEPFAQAEIARLADLRIAAREERVEADLALGHHADVVPELEALVAEHPLRERLRGQLMVALYRSGRQAEALAVYRDTRRTLVEELGIEPTRELQELHRAVLAQDPALDVPPASATPPRHAEDPRAEGPSSSTSFVGRQRELEEVSTRLEAALSGHPGLVLLAGEAGIGKSRLADEVANLAVGRGARVLWGRCWEAGGAPAYWPWVQALRSYIRDRDSAKLRHELGAGAPDVAQMLPELRQVLGDLPSPPSLDPEGARFRLFDSTTAFLRVAGEEQPLVLVLDDMHAADASSLLLLRFVARELRNARVVLVVAYRDSEAAANQDLAEGLAELRREPITRLVSLGGLGVGEVAGFIESITGTAPAEELVTAVHRQTEGNPLFVGELVRLLVSEGRLDEVGVDGIGSVPRGVREVIGHRLRRLSPGCKRLLAVASILGREFQLEALQGVAGALRDDLLDLLDEALRERVVGEVPARRGGLRFSHALIRDSLYGDLGATERLRLHRHAAEALRDLYAQDEEPHLAELAHHFLEAAPGGDVDVAIDYARRAADRAASLLAYEEAARLYEMALEALQMRRLPDEPARCELLLGLGDAQARGGDLPRAKDTFARAAKLAKDLREPELLARAALGYGGRFVWFRAGKDRKLIPLLEDALSMQPEGDSMLAALLLTRLAGALRDHPVPERRTELSDEAVSMARRLGDRATLARALEGRVAALAWPSQIDEWLETVEEMIRLAEQAGDLEQAFMGHLHALSMAIMEGDVELVEEQRAIAMGLADSLRQPAQRWAIAITEGMLALLRGDLEEADQLVERQVEMGRSAQGLDMTFYFATTLQLWALRRDQGRLAEIQRSVEDFVEEYPATAIFRCLLANLHAELGHRSAAAQELERIAAYDFAALHLGTEYFLSACLLAEVCSYLGDTERASSLYEALIPYGGYCVLSHPEVCIGSAARYLGILATTLERWEDAARHLQQALEANARMGARPWVARTREDYARMLLARDAPGDRERAGELLRAAVEDYRLLGMDGAARRVDRREVAPPVGS